MQVDGSGGLVRDHGEVLLFAVDLDGVPSAGRPNALRLWGRREKRLE